MIVLFLDSNVFLQCKPLKELPWHEIDGDEVRLLVPHVVQKELDRLKGDGNSRRSSRARAAGSLFRDAIEQTNEELVIAPQSPRVALSFPPAMGSLAKLPDTLDLTRNDDRLVGEVLAYAAGNPSSTVKLLTDDTYASLSAKRHGVSCLLVPELWLLPSEPDPRDKELARLKSELAEATKLAPVLLVGARDADGTKIERLSLTIKRFTKPTPAVIENLVKNAQAIQPLEKVRPDRGMPSERARLQDERAGASWSPVTQAQIADYCGQYEAWVKKISQALERTPVALQEIARRVNISFFIENTGNIPAESVIIEISATDGISFTRDTQMPGTPVLPFAPKPPEARRRAGWAELLTSRPGPELMPRPIDYANLGLRGVEDPHAFYFREGGGKGQESYWRLVCHEFRHQQADPEVFSLQLRLPIPLEGSKNGAVTFRVSAANLPKPTTVTVPIAVVGVDEDGDGAVQAALAAWEERGRKGTGTERGL